MAQDRLITRIETEIKKLREESDGAHFSIGQEDITQLKWKAMILGPNGSLYEGGQFDVSIEIPLGYPNKAPKVFFKTKIYHPNLEAGAIIDFPTWNKHCNLSWVLNGILSLLKQPQTTQSEVYHACKANWPKYVEEAKSWTTIYAKKD